MKDYVFTEGFAYWSVAMTVILALVAGMWGLHTSGEAEHVREHRIELACIRHHGHMEQVGTNWVCSFEAKR